ncbi:MAG: carboxymuconolactone decarboxylase family protein [Planctomycetes bacterium]|nr:carboxymuconolactone decarboxylase family protein [Planctomycetota bacterium]MCP4771788.1 carboxymuconolactone decarboxylase family protein [Planctomycetota bacterium]MCP4860969.1 carboxymuconolactone decarboxylase family protein [Planctomycetota bacterium]
MSRLTPIFNIASALHHGNDDRLLVVCSQMIQHPEGNRALMQDVLRLCHLFCGFPKVVRALNLVCHEFGFAEEQDLINHGGNATGEEMFTEVYGTDTEPVLAHLQRVDPTFLSWVVEHAYGTTFNATDLSLEERERLSVVALAASGCWQQARSHIRACLRHGVSLEDLLADLERVEWLSSEQQDLAATCIHTENESK